MAPSLVAKRLRVSRKVRSCLASRLADQWAGSAGVKGAERFVLPTDGATGGAPGDAGPAAHGWAEDQRWTLTRVKALIEQLFPVSYTLRGTSYLLDPLGWIPQVPQRRAAEAIATWVKETWPSVGRPPGTRRRGSASRTKQASR